MTIETRTLLVRHAALGGRAHVADVLRERAARRAQRRRREARASPRELGLGHVELEVSDAELARRRAAWTAPPLRATRGALAKYIRNVRPASEGCVTDE